LRNRARRARRKMAVAHTQPTRGQTAQHGASGRERMADSGMSQDESFTGGCAARGGGPR
jgi:hypothetical protein